MKSKENQEREKKERQFKKLVLQGLEGSFNKQKAVFERSSKTKAVYEEIKKIARF